ncbi:Eco57I restriction-modification methylase domain-containing protein [Streptosporangium roseum]|uniref:site-specific DNA-methyltransferase (adenine-specific) n=1 Tax=Streptosporangium roseum (strain ATCC 12428 / DSM 43021 / JCM 3005 / KCTC 9067 / NCIMB 10171 / NRRL 2505 / NI 9100) TaxID=479432 RepID=D2AT17_STRRD|nr:DNA methyltransferase [Streptosporangium roseum]ACZ90494.1 putative type II DNA modification enzyme [Streptosporangium roseum DSM 43021]
MRGTSYLAVEVAGGLIPQDVLSRIGAADRELPGIRPEDYHLAASERLGDAASRRWDYLLGAYRAFRERVDGLPDGDPATTPTRERWLQVLLSELGFGHVPYIRGGLKAGDKEFPVSHLWHNVPMHLLGWNTRLDRATPGRAETKRAPQSMLQEFLNLSDDHLWGVLSNGRQLRILRDSTALVGSAYVEFDLEAIFDGELYSEFVLLYTLLHASRFELISGDDSTPTCADCWLEKWRAFAAETGLRARDQLRDGVQKALEALGTGFLVANPGLRDQLVSGALKREDFHHELLRLAYQLIFLFVAEDRGALLTPDAAQDARDRYATYFSTRRLRSLAARRAGDRHTDLWKTTARVIRALGDDDGLPMLGLPGLGGLFFRTAGTLAELTDTPVPDQFLVCDLPNEALLTAVRHMSTVRGKDGRPRDVDFQHLGAEELGSVYESLLELVPHPDLAVPTFELKTVAGNDRKTTGSYYTPSSLIESLLDTALDPVIDEHAKSGVADDLLKITVCDPACGSGHFLVAAARRIAKRYAAMVTGEAEPVPSAVQKAMHKVVGTCIYGVDIQPLAAELAKFSLWMESLEPGKPLAFLDAHIKVGNSLLGTTPRLLDDGIPDEAFKAIEGDDRKIVASLKKDNARQRRNQGMLFTETGTRLGNKELAGEVQALAAVPVSTVADVREQERRFREFERSDALTHARLVADAWCAAFVWRKHADAPPAITTDTVRRLQEGGGLPSAVALELDRLVERYRFFHWHLEFPDVFDAEAGAGSDANAATGWRGGFTCVLGNPPWERVKLQEKEFFAARHEGIANAKNAAARKKAIAALATSAEETDRWLFAEFAGELRSADGWTHLLRESGRYPLTGRGDINTYAVFAETGRTLLAPSGRVGMVLPTGIATDATTQFFFKDMVTTKTLASLYDFENEDKLFAHVHHSFRFCLWTGSGPQAPRRRIDLAFRLRQVAHLDERSFTLTPEDITLLNPNTGTCPVFDFKRNAEITLGIYRRVPVLWRENPKSNPWELSFMAMLHMANDSGLFRPSAEERETLEGMLAAGWQLDGNHLVKGDERLLPLFEAKMLHHFDDRFGTYEGQTQAQANVGTLPRPAPVQKGDPAYVVQPRYWVAEKEVQERLCPGNVVEGDRRFRKWDKGWLLGWRDICRSSDERTLIDSVFPRTATPDTTLLMLPNRGSAACLSGNLSSFILDYVVRQKSSGTHLKYFTVRQLPILSPEAYGEDCLWGPGERLHLWVRARVLELSYTSYGLEAFARDNGDKGAPYRWDEERRFWLRAELDAAYFHLYGVVREDVDYIMDTFRAFRNKSPDLFERTKKAILEIYDAMQDAIDGRKPYQTPLDPPPGHGPRHPERRA